MFVVRMKKGFCVVAAVLLVYGAVTVSVPRQVLAATEGEEYMAGQDLSDAARGVVYDGSSVKVVDVEAADDDAELMVAELEENNGALFYGGTASDMAGPGEEQQVSLNYSKIIRHEGWFTRSFTVNYEGKERVAYCIEPKDYPPEKGAHTATVYDGELMKKALYYAYGYPGFEEKMRPYLDEAELNSAYSGNDGAYVVSHLLLSYFYDGESETSDAFKGLGDKTKATIRDLAYKLKTQWPDVPDNSELKLDRTSLEAEWNPDKMCQETPVVKLEGNSTNRISVRIPEGATMIKLSGNELTEHSSDPEALQTVEVCGGDEFFFTAPESVNGTYESGNMTGSAETFQPYVIKVADKQDIMYCGDGVKSSVSFTIKWESIGTFILDKTSAAPELTEGNERYSLKNAEYEIYDEKGDVYEKVRTDEEGDSKVLLPYGNYGLKEVAAPEGYLADETLHEINMDSESVTFVHEEQPVPAETDHSPQTGDESTLVYMFAAALLSMSVIVICICRKAM